LNFQCKKCKTSNVRKDDEARAAKLIRQAGDSGYFLTQDQCVNKILAENSMSIEDANINETNTSESSTTCCWSMILSQQSDFLKERPLLQTIIEDAGYVCLFLS
jgi:hypothetical protein